MLGDLGMDGSKIIKNNNCTSRKDGARLCGLHSVADSSGLQLVVANPAASLRVP